MPSLLLRCFVIGLLPCGPNLVHITAAVARRAKADNGRTDEDRVAAGDDVAAAAVAPVVNNTHAYTHIERERERERTRPLLVP